MVPIEADVLFDSNGVMTPGIVHILGTSQIIVNVPGDYEVTFSVSGTEPNQFALFLNGTEVPGQFMVLVQALSKITVRLYSPYQQEVFLPFVIILLLQQLALHLS